MSTYKFKRLALKSPPGAILKIAGLEDTIYSKKPDEVNGWGKFYLPKIVNMQVLGVVEGTPSPCDQLVLMTCEDKKLYGYDGEELHLVASSLEKLNDKEIQYPAAKSYYNGEAFEDMVRSLSFTRISRVFCMKLVFLLYLQLWSVLRRLKRTGKM